MKSQYAILINISIRDIICVLIYTWRYIMKKMLLITIILLCMVLSACGNKASPIEDFEFKLQDGEAIITGYKGSDLKIYIPSKIDERPVTQIGKNAFEEYDMTYINIPDSVKKILDNAFKKCTCLETVKFSKSLELIGNSAFEECTNLNNVKLPTGLIYLEANAFASCDSLTKLEIPDNTKMNIGAYERPQGNIGYMVTFTSPIGSSYVIYYYNHNAQNNVNFEELPTVLIVSNGSSAHKQLIGYEKYSLKFEVK